MLSAQLAKRLQSLSDIKLFYILTKSSNSDVIDSIIKSLAPKSCDVLLELFNSSLPDSSHLQKHTQIFKRIAIKFLALGLPPRISHFAQHSRSTVIASVFIPKFIKQGEPFEIIDFLSKTIRFSNEFDQLLVDRIMDLEDRGFISKSLIMVAISSSYGRKLVNLLSKTFYDKYEDDISCPLSAFTSLTTPWELKDFLIGFVLPIADYDACFYIVKSSYEEDTVLAFAKQGVYKGFFTDTCLDKLFKSSHVKESRNVLLSIYDDSFKEFL